MNYEKTVSSITLTIFNQRLKNGFAYCIQWFRLRKLAVGIILGLVTVGLFFSSPIRAAIILNPASGMPGGANYDASDPLTGLPVGQTGSVQLDPLAVTRLTPAGEGSTLFTAFAADAASQFPSWTIQQGGFLNGTMTINAYQAIDCNLPPGCSPLLILPAGGANMNATYTRNAADPAITDLRFIQVFTDNTGENGALVSHIDPIPNDPGDTLPWYWTEAQHTANSTANTMTFSDRPGDTVTSLPFERSVDFEVYLATFDLANKKAIIHDGINWGYNVTVIPIPASILLLLSGLSTFGLIGYKSTRRGRSREAV